MKLSKWLRENGFPPPMLPMVCGYAPLTENVLNILKQRWDIHHSPTAEKVPAEESAVWRGQPPGQNTVDDADSPDRERKPVVRAPLPNQAPPADLEKGGASKIARKGADMEVQGAASEDARNLEETARRANKGPGAKEGAAGNGVEQLEGDGAEHDGTGLVSKHLDRENVQGGQGSRLRPKSRKRVIGEKKNKKGEAQERLRGRHIR